MSLRKYISIIERHRFFNETYSQENGYLLRYMKNKEFDPYNNWQMVCSWLYQNNFDKVIEALSRQGINVTVTNEEELEDEDPDIFYHLPKDIQKRCAEAVVEKLMSIDPANAPTWAHMDLKKEQLLPRNTWLIHFTNEPHSIATKGFTVGMDDIERLGLTTYFSKQHKSYGGYNFAFLVPSRDANWAAAKGKYGKSAVMFQNSGVHAYHYSDAENQVMFLGKDVKPRDIVILMKHDGEWQVNSYRNTKRGDDVLFHGDFNKCVDWVIKNYNSYRRTLADRR